jgi:diguanylate cyclase (GGDEF)-like protein/PAS domain S-box-containing protein
MAELMTGGPQTSAQPRRWTIVRPDGTERKVEAYTLLVAFDGTPAVLVAFVDITEQVEAESVIAASERRQREVIDALQRSEARLHSLVAQSPVGIFETDPEGGCVYVNDRWSELTGSTFEASLGWGWADAVHPDDRVRLLTGFRAALAGASPFATELRYRRSSGEVVHVHLEARPLYGDAGTLTGWLGTATDLTAQVALRTELAESEARFRELADGSPDVVVRMRIDPVSFDYVGPAIASLTGCPAETYVREPELLESQIHPDDIERVTAVATDPDAVGHVEFRLLHRDGTYHVVEARLHRRIVDDVVVGLHATLRDVTAAADLREHLRDLSRRDPLTGLLNRRALVDALHERVARHEPTALLFIDLDDFKSVNDTLGHDAGDDVLTAIAGRLSGGLRAGTLVSRFAGDEFVVVLDPAVAEDVAVRLREQAARPIVLRGGASATVGMSIGVAELDPNVSQPVADLLHRADDAMYRAKRRARDAR